LIFVISINNYQQKLEKKTILKMVVSIAYSVQCFRDLSLNYKNSEEKIVYEKFMTTIKCNYNISMLALRQHLQSLYPFLIIDDITDLDGEPVMWDQELRQVWKGYQSFKDEFDEDYFSQDDEDNNNLPLPDETIYIFVRSHFFDDDKTNLEKFHQLIKEHPYSDNLIKESKQYDISDEYCVKFPSGEKYSFNGHSYDGLEGNNTLIDQLLTSSEKYIITNTETNQAIELSTQQCIIVDSYNHRSLYKPYIMVNKTGLRELERLGPIETLKIRFGHKEEMINELQMNTYNDDATKKNSYQSVLSAYSDLVELFSDIYNSPIAIKSSEKQVIKTIERELLPLLNTIKDSLCEPGDAGNNSINTTTNNNHDTGNDDNVNQGMIMRWIRWNLDVSRRFTNRWILNGLLISILSCLLQYTLKSLLFLFILYRLNLKFYFLMGAVFFIGLLDENVLATISKIGNEGGITWFLKIHAFLERSKIFLKILLKGSITIIINACLIQRPIYLEDGSMTKEESDNESSRLNRWGVFGRVFFGALRFLQDFILCLVTLFPPGVFELDTVLVLRRAMAKKKEIENEEAEEIVEQGPELGEN
jgi:hypothetical protein